MTTQHPQFQPQPPKQKMSIWLKLLIGAGAAFAALVLLGAVVGGGASEPEATASDNAATETTTEAAAAPATTPSEKPKASPKPKATPEQKLTAAVKKVNSRAKVDADPALTTITFPIADNFSNGMIATGAQSDTVDLLEAVKKSGYETESVEIDGMFETTDDYGNSDDSAVVRVMYSSEVLDMINFDGVNYETIWDIADEMSFVHPDLRG